MGVSARCSMLHCAVRVSEKEERESLHVELCVCVQVCASVCKCVCVYIFFFLLFFACAACFLKTFLAQRPARARQTRSCLESLMICNQSPSRLCSGYMSPDTQTVHRTMQIFFIPTLGHNAGSIQRLPMRQVCRTHHLLSPQGEGHSLAWGPTRATRQRLPQCGATHL